MTKDEIEKIYEELPHRKRDRDLFAIRSLLDKTRIIVEPVPYKLVPEAHAQKEWDTLRIVTISTKSRLRINKTPKECLFAQDFREKTIDYKLYFHEPFDEVYDKYIATIRKAASYRPDFVCINELGFPNFWNCGDPLRRKADLLDEEIQEVVDEHGFYLIAGSFHDPVTLHNLCKVYFPQAKVNLESPLCHAKKTSATRAKEKIKIPYNRYIRCYCTKDVNFVVLICLDSYDPSIITRIIQQNKSLRDATFQLIFVPSFTTHSPNAEEACRNISYLCGNIVVYVNTFEYSPRSSVFVAGKDPNTTGKKITRGVELITLSNAEYLAKRNEAIESQTEHFDFLFGADPDIYRY